MSKHRALFAVLVATFSSALPGVGAKPQGEAQAFEGRVATLPADVMASMRHYSWRPGCPLALEQLAYVVVSYWGFDQAVHRGELVVDAALATEVVAIFRVLFEARFPIEKLRLVDAYRGNDEDSMSDNNSSAFNCRWVTGKAGVFSKHSYGRAIDLNPRQNPFVTKERVSPATGAAFVERQRPGPGMILVGDVVYRTFLSYGWLWGGSWRSLKDYQHFEKPMPATSAHEPIK